MSALNKLSYKTPKNYTKTLKFTGQGAKYAAVGQYGKVYMVSVYLADALAYCRESLNRKAYVVDIKTGYRRYPNKAKA